MKKPIKRIWTLFLMLILLLIVFKSVSSLNYYPNITINSPIDNFKYMLNENNITEININVTITDYEALGNYTINLYNDSETIIYYNKSTGNTIEYYFNRSIFNNSGIYYLNVIAIDNASQMISRSIIFYTIPYKKPFTPIGLTEYDLTNTNNIMLLFIIVILYLGCIIIGFTFKSRTFLIFGFIIGIILGFMLSGLHPFMTILFILINTLLFYQLGKKIN